MSMSRLMVVLGALLLFSTSGNAEEPAAEVMVIGVFHFKNPGLDMVKTEQMNVVDDASQAYLEELSARIAEEYRPTRVLVEYQASSDDLMQKRYQEYLAGSYELGVNEIYQLGFRIAKEAGGISVQGYDDRTIGWDSEQLFQVLPTAAPEINEVFQQIIADVTRETEEDHSTLTLQELLLKNNAPEQDRLNMDTYILLNQVATPGNHEGAVAASSWWHRNFRMYAIIQRAAGPGERLLVIGGQGHTAILKNFLDIDGRLKSVDVRPLL